MNFLTLDDGRKELYQWDTGRFASVTLEEVNEVHFANLKYGKPYDMAVEDGKVEIPPEVLQTGEAIYCWAYVGTVSSGYTYTEQFFTVNKRPKPTDYVYTPTEIKSFEKLSQEVKDIIPVEVENALEEAKASGDFKGDKGDKGDKGEKGDPGSVTVDNEMSDESTNPVQNKVAKAYIDKNGIKTLSIEQIPNGIYNAWELEDGMYRINNPDGSLVVSLEASGSYDILYGFFVIISLEDFNVKMIYSFMFDINLCQQNIVCLTVDSETGFEVEDVSAGYFASQKWVDERLSALESAFADLTLGE